MIQAGTLAQTLGQAAPEKPRLWRETWGYFAQNRGAVLGLAAITAFIVVAVLAPWISPYDPSRVHDGLLQLRPLANGQFPLGTDDIGRDVLSRLLYGARISLGIGFLAVCLSVSVGTTLGLTAGYFGGIVGTAILRVMDMMMALPSLLLAIVVVSILGPNLGNAILAVSLVQIPTITRLVRAATLSEKVKPYVAASRCFGASHLRQMFINILPNARAPLIVQATLGFSDAILDAAALGFLGLGAQPPTPEWGTMLADSRPFIESAPWLVTLPGLCILCVVLSFNLLGDGLRDALDPRLRR